VIQPEELALVSSDPRDMRAAVARVLRERSSASASPSEARRLARDFLKRLDRSGAHSIDGASPRILALMVGRLHEDYCDRLGTFAVTRREPSRAKYPTTDLVMDLLLALSALKMRESEREKRVATVVSGFWGVPITAQQVKRRAATRAHHAHEQREQWIREGLRSGTLVRVRASFDPTVIGVTGVGLRRIPKSPGAVYDLPRNTKAAAARREGRRDQIREAANAAAKRRRESSRPPKPPR